jgi:hypothetical protein
VQIDFLLLFFRLFEIAFILALAWGLKWLFDHFANRHREAANRRHEDESRKRAAEIASSDEKGETAVMHSVSAMHQNEDRWK